MSIITPPGQIPSDGAGRRTRRATDSCLKRLANLQSVWILGVLLVIVVVLLHRRRRASSCPPATSR